MRNSKISDVTPQNIDLLLFDNFSNHCLANTIEPLRAANSLARRTLYQWRFLTLDGQAVHSSSGLQVSPHAALRAGGGDMLVVMPSYGFRALDTRQTTAPLSQFASRYAQVAGFDTGSWLLARAGLLEGYRATIHWQELSGFEEAFPGTDAVRERYVIDRDRITCSGAMAAFDLVLWLIGQAHGAALTVEVAQLFMSSEAARPTAGAGATNTRMVERALHLMQGNLEQPLRIVEIARQVGVSQKTLEMRMQAELQHTPQAFYRRLRLNLARHLVEGTDQSMTEIAGRCGYDNASAMTRAFKAQFGCPPRDVRKAGIH